MSKKVILKSKAVTNRTFATLTIVFGLFFSFALAGVSFADNLPAIVSKISKAVSTTPEKKLVGIYGTVSEVSTGSLIFNAAQGSYTVDTTKVSKIETKAYVPLLITDISVGDNLIVQGFVDGMSLDAKRIVSFSATSSKGVVPDMNATTTDALSGDSSASSTATSTPDSTATSTDATSTEQVVGAGTVINTPDEVSTSTTSTDIPESATSSQPSTTTPSDAGSVAPIPDPVPTPDPVQSTDPAPAPVTPEAAPVSEPAA